MEKKMTKVGNIKEIFRYAVKSMGGELIDEAVIIDGGILGDRGYAIIEQSSEKIASAKMPKLWGPLLELQAKFTQEPASGEPLPSVSIKWPDGSENINTDDEINKKLSQALGRSVKITSTKPDTISLERLDPLEEEETILDIGDIMMEGRFSDYAAIHLVTTSSINKLHTIDPDRSYEAGRFRPNIIIDTEDLGQGFVENNWVGKIIRIGEKVKIRITDPTPRCAIPTLAQAGGIKKDSKILKTIVEHNSQPVPLLDDEILPCVGVYGFILNSGQIKIDDTISIE
ncbi:MAG: hypothetical protein CMM30_01700 [Rhodospirillaceae bacterium]|nr:hypothetical protein [Rhodospirillaceae bacterium]